MMKPHMGSYDGGEYERGMGLVKDNPGTGSELGFLRSNQIAFWLQTLFKMINRESGG
jgi:hypothetical protein